MSLATAAMAVLGLTVVWMRWAPASAPSGRAALALSMCFSVPGFFLGLATLRGRTNWFWLALVPVLANLMLIALPWVELQLRQAR